MQSAQNQAPVVNTGDDQTVNSRQQVSARDPEDGELSYLWQQQLSQQVALVNGYSPTTRFAAPSNAGTLVFKLTATDELGTSESDEVTIAVRTNAPRRGGGSGSGYLLWMTLLLYLSRRKQRSKN